MNRVEVTAKTAPSLAQRMTAAHDAVNAIHKSNAEAREAIDRYLKARGVTLESLTDQSEGFRRDCYGAIKEALQDWTKLKAPRFDPLRDRPEEEIKKVTPVEPEPVEPVEPVSPVKRAEPVEPPTSSQDCADSNGAANELADMIRRIVGTPEVNLNESRFEELFGHHIENGVNWNNTGVVKLIDERMKDARHRIEIHTPGGNVKPISGLMHRQTTQIATWANANVPVWAWGGAGAGKSHMFYQIAEMLDYTDDMARLVSVGPTTTATSLIGFCVAGNGDYKEGLLYQPFKDGWIVGLDEPACGDASVLAQLNAMIANDRYTFPNGETVKRHERFRMLCFDNTKGTGATAGYTARTRLDAATMDRFAVIELHYDEDLEYSLCTGEAYANPHLHWKAGQVGEHLDLCKQWVKWVQAVRAYVGKSVLISPRASMLGVRAIRAGIPVSEVKEALVFKLVSDDTRSRIESEVKGGF
jgi:hypothetical protein